MRKIIFATPLGVITMCVGDDGPVDRFPWIDVHIRNRAINALGRKPEKFWAHVTGCGQD